jgi:hypothetical protein
MTPLQKGYKSRVDLRTFEFVGQISRNPLDLRTGNLNFIDIERHVGRNSMGFDFDFEADLFAVESLITR